MCRAMTSAQTSTPTRRRSPTAPTEHASQVALVQWFRWQYPGVRIFAVPNAGRRSPAAANWFRAEGMSRGVPDLWIPAWRVAIEMKRSKGGRITAEQHDWAKYLSDIGWTHIFAHGLDDAVRQIRATRQKDSTNSVGDAASSDQKLLCTECNWHGHEHQTLRSPHPFADGSILRFCPQCKSAEHFALACDEPGCWKPVACGTPTNSAYRLACEPHHERQVRP